VQPNLMLGPFAPSTGCAPPIAGQELRLAESAKAYFGISFASPAASAFILALSAP